jgi:hypothetical protein
MNFNSNSLKIRVPRKIHFLDEHFAPEPIKTKKLKPIPGEGRYYRDMFDMLEGLRLGMPLASFGEDMIPIFAILVVFGIPIIAILTTHQRKMTELIHRNNPQTVDPMVQQQLANMEHQISDLRSMMQEHIINNDRSTLSPPPTPTVEQRLNQ